MQFIKILWACLCNLLRFHSLLFRIITQRGLFLSDIWFTGFYEVNIYSTFLLFLLVAFII